MNTVTLPPKSQPDENGHVAGGWWHESGDDDRIVCDLCPRECSLKPGDRGFCFVRQNSGGKMLLTTYGRSTGFCIDPIEKKPLNHFHPGTAVLSFGTAGCNLGCRFCQNWDISKSREVSRLSELAWPEMIAAAAKKTGCRSVAFTYNDPIIWAEYAIDTAAACRTEGIRTVAVTAGYISETARPTFFHAMDAANVDLKAFTEDFYHRITYSHLRPVLETLQWLKHESDVWFEITNLIIPSHNDADDDLKRMCEWILNSVGPDVPVHFSAFHPDFRMTDIPQTPHETLLRAHRIARDCGIRYVYTGNVSDVQHQSTWCPQCGELLIERNWYQLGRYQLQDNRCGSCGAVIAGHFDKTPGNWGSRRQPIRISDYLPQTPRPEVQPSATKSSTTSAKEDLMQSVQESPQLSEQQEAAIHKAACEIVTAIACRRPPRLSDVTLDGTADKVVMGAFVTLKRTGMLRSCCGSLGQPMKLAAALEAAAVRTAKEDHRFPPISPTELPYLTLDVTLLFNFEPIRETGADRARAVEIGKHGLRIQRGNQAGLLLPVVAVENHWDASVFLNQVCRKAGLPITAWQQPDTELLRFEGRMVERDFDAESLDSAADARPESSVTDAELQTLAAFARSNILALEQGAVPGCFPGSVSDGTVDGVVLQLHFPGIDEAPVFSKIQLRNGMPLQMTLLQLTDSAAAWLRQQQLPAGIRQGMKVDFMTLSDPAAHGTADNADLRGIEPSRRAVLVSENRRMAWVFDPQQSADELLRQACQSVDSTSAATTLLYSLAARTTAERICSANVPRAQSGPEERPPAVAGAFYSAEPNELARDVTEDLGTLPAEKEVWPAVMVPHAGLKYSGHIAADVLKRIQIPSTVIIIGPKHTPHGVDWAIAPHRTWRIPGATLQNDPELVTRLTERISGLKPDAAAHALEHAIEVELPYLARLAPDVKVVGIAIGSGSIERCRKFGQELALLMSEMEEPPLLIISSDMNHFAGDSENRRLDEMALAAMETRDPVKLYETVTQNGISMCGMLPAFIVMEALLCLDQLDRTERTQYATSADVTGDKTRVVGYAGMLLGP
ncbi:MAG: AmmeMemoRadiSam system radical SAM enzyme [Planctomycetaceae bacterium]|nr:AmmeMemoRadiSam system radical SAM enzyme [Planctomycetaceae bacterium]